MRNPEDEAIQSQFPDQFASYTAQLGYTNPDELLDMDHHAVANQILRDNLQALYGQAVAADGFSLDMGQVGPYWKNRMASAGATHRDAAAFARGLYPDLAPHEAVARYQRDIARASGASVPEPKSPMFDRPF